jgi:hypothetical protein
VRASANARSMKFATLVIARDLCYQPAHVYR